MGFDPFYSKKSKKKCPNQADSDIQTTNYNPMNIYRVPEGFLSNQNGKNQFRRPDIYINTGTTDD